MQCNLAIWHFYYSLNPFYIASVRIYINTIFTAFFLRYVKISNKKLISK